MILMNLLINSCLHFLISFCSSYTGTTNASLKNQTELTAQRNGNNANPAKFFI